MKEHKYPLGDMDDIQFRMSCAIGLLRAAHECIEHGDSAPGNYTDAIFGAYNYLWMLNAELRECIEAMTADQGDAGKVVGV